LKIEKFDSWDVHWSRRLISELLRCLLCETSKGLFEIGTIGSSDNWLVLPCLICIQYTHLKVGLGITLSMDNKLIWFVY